MEQIEEKLLEVKREPLPKRTDEEIEEIALSL